MSTATESSVTVRIDPTANSQQADIIMGATTEQAGVMTTAQVVELRSLIAGTSVFFAIYSNATRPAANDPTLGAVVGVKAAVIWNSSDKAPNFSDGVHWYNAVGQLT